MSRLVSNGIIIFDQITVYDPANSYDRVGGLSNTDFTLNLFANNEKLSWSLEDGSSILSANISPGSIYIEEITGATGYYSIRWFPDRVGYWMLSLVYTGNGMEIIREYDVMPSNFFPNSNSGLISSFT